MSNTTRTYRYYDLVMAGFVTVLLLSNIMGVSKVTELFGYPFSAGNLFFPISYIFGDILTEVYGYARARKVVWAGFASLAFASFMAWVVVSMPPAQGFANQAAVETIFGATPRIALASLCGFFCGEFCNSYTLAKMKVWTNGKHLWSRTIGSTVVGEMADTLVFYPIAFLGVLDTAMVLKIMLTNYTLKVAWEVINTPITYKVVAFLKRAEKEDYFDRDTDFTPFSLS
ncbi:MAG: queuosine precursor transporter [Pseudomonadota bacterium]|jgi:uncharacterized integral membrane protein (TIGR00697 family)